MYCPPLPLRPLRKCAVSTPVFQCSWKGSVAETENQAKYIVADLSFLRIQFLRLLLLITKNSDGNFGNEKGKNAIFLVSRKLKGYQISNALQWCQDVRIFGAISDQHLGRVTLPGPPPLDFWKIILRIVPGIYD